MTSGKTFLVTLQRLLLAAGTTLLALYFAALAHNFISSRMALSEFDRSTARRGNTNSPITRASTGARTFGASEVRLESDKRTPGGRGGREKNGAIAVLQFARLGARIPVFEGTNTLALNSGAGWIAGTSRPGEAGNIGIAGHRDGAFNILKDISTGDSIELTTTTTVAKYTVEQIVVVSPNNTDVLRQRGTPSLTLVTCYPFNYIGPAPKRYILFASVRNQTDAGDTHDQMKQRKGE